MRLNAKRREGVAWLIVFLFLAWWVHFWPTFHAANEAIRLYFVQAVVDHGTPVIDEPMKRYRQKNSDRAEFEGESYMDKAPGLSYLAMPVYWVATRVLDMSTEFPDLPKLMHLLLLFGVVIPAVFGAWCVRRLVLAETHNDTAAWFAAIGTAIATPYALYGTLFFGHTPAAACAIASVWASRRNVYVAGAFAGGMVFIDTATCVLATAIGIWVGVRNRSFRNVLEFGVGGLPFIAAQLAYNTWLFGEPHHFAYSYKASADLKAIHDKGLFGFDIPRWDALWGLTFGGMRGLFFHSPVLLLALLGGRKAVGLLLICAAHFLWIACFVDWPAGASYGPRHLVPIVPLLMVCAGQAVARILGLRWVSAPLLVFSAALTLAVIATFPYAPGAFDIPLVQQGLPMFVERHFSPNVMGLEGVAALVFPLLALVALAALLVGKQRRVWALGLGGVLLFGLTLLYQPRLTDKQLRSRAFAEALMGHPETGKTLCEDRDGMRWAERAWQCVPKRKR